jgi:hypothetical protein
MFFVWGVPLKSYSTFSTVLWILAINLPLKHTFVSFDLCNDPIPQFSLSHIVYLAEMCILSYQASWYVSPVPRYARKRLSWESPLTAPKWGIFGGLLRHGFRRIDETPKRHLLGWNHVDWCIICGARALKVGCGLAREVTRKKNFPNRIFHLCGEPRPPGRSLWTLAYLVVPPT